MALIRKNTFFVPQEYRAITLYPFIFVRNDSDKHDKFLINYESIHIKQQKELLVLLFYVWYVLDWLRKIFIYKSVNLAYLNIVFEREAYENEDNLEYLKMRKRFNFRNYIKPKNKRK